jgi:multimeric flavodoxin WrbA
MSKKVLAIVGSYRKGGTIDAAVEAVLEGAREKGAVTRTIYLVGQHIEFCTNCRECMQAPGPERGKCAQQDDLEPILTEIEAADAIVLGSPVNCYNATAIFRRFMERLVGFAYWPWGKAGFLIPLATGTARALRVTATMLGARTVGSLWIGLAAGEPHHALSARVRERARHIGWKLA